MIFVSVFLTDFLLSQSVIHIITIMESTTKTPFLRTVHGHERESYKSQDETNVASKTHKIGGMAMVSMGNVVPPKPKFLKHQTRYLKLRTCTCTYFSSHEGTCTYSTCTVRPESF